MMRAVWTFWSPPFLAGRGCQWRLPRHHLLAWGMSLRLAEQHYPQTSLFTDSGGRALLVDALELPFTHVSTELDQLEDEDPALWALGKMLTYSLQDEPFVHVDADVFLWRALPERLTSAPVLAQHPERFHVADRFSGARVIEDAFTSAGGELPAEWEWARSHWGRRINQANCGIVGGRNVEFIRHYARTALELVMNPDHAPIWTRIRETDGLNQLFEQFMLSASVEFHRFNPQSPFGEVHTRYLFPSTAAAFSPAAASRAGYTHLLGEAKGDVAVTERLERRVKEEDSALFARCSEVAESAEAWG